METRTPETENTAPNLGSSISRHPSPGVGNLDTQSLGLRDDFNALARRDCMTDLSSVGAVVHEEKFDVRGVFDEERLVARGGHVPSLLVGAVSDRGHGSLSLEPSPHTVVNTLGLPPCRWNTFKAVALVAAELLGPLLDDGDMLLCSGHLD